jgi:UPF0042 nucleotide-binding protein
MADADALREAGVPALPDGPAAPTPPMAAPQDGSVMSLVDHLGELRTRLFRSILAVAVGALLGFAVSDQAITILRSPIPSDSPLFFTGLGDAFVIKVKIAIVIGVILAMPVLLYQLWAFISPGLTPAERRAARPWIPIALFFFALGVGIAWIVLPYAAQFLLGFQSADLQALITAGPYFDFVTTMFLAFGAPVRHPRDRHLLRGGHAGWRPGQPVRPRRDDVPALRADRPVHPAQRTVTGPADARDEGPVAAPTVVILTGLSGGGKTAAAKLFEDLGYTVVDNLPGELLPDLAELVSSDRQRFAHIAIVLDVRAGDATLALAAMRGALEGRGIRPRVVFLEASDDVLIRRFSETRHRHPLGDEHGIATSISEERRILEPVRAEADLVLDTSELSLRQLRERLFAQLATEVRADQLSIQIISFGYKYGIPLEADLVFDVRFMQNPYYVAELRRQSGLTDEVRAFVLGQPVATQFLDYIKAFLAFTIPAYIAEGKTRLTIGLGCTGGYHRSIVIGEELASWLREQDFGPVAVFHRELDRS